MSGYNLNETCNMTYEVHIPTRILEDSVSLALSKKKDARSDFFHELRTAFRKHIETILESKGIRVFTERRLGHTYYLKHATYHEMEPFVKYDGPGNRTRLELDIEFCARYGHGDYSLGAVNYIDRLTAAYPSLASLKGVFSIGNILVLVENGNYDVKLTLGSGIHATGYAYHISSRKKKSYLCLFGIWFDPELINPIIEKHISTHTETQEELDEIKLGQTDYPMLYIDRVTGDLFTCQCFDGYFETNRCFHGLPYDGTEEGLRARERKVSSMPGLCNLCKGGMPRFSYGRRCHSKFLEKYLPYHRLLSMKKYGKKLFKSAEYDEIENELRKHFGYPLIGEEWVSETHLYYTVKLLLPEYSIIRNYRGPELEGLELDVWLSELRIGIEYQGEQHFKVVEHWGGEEGLLKRKANDKKKKKLCAKLGYHLIEFLYTEDINEELVDDRLRETIEKIL